MLNNRFLLSFLFLYISSWLSALNIPEEHVLQMAQKIWYNECRGTIKGLTCWNAGEEFASMGIGHFIWYPKGRKGAYEETFPALLAFLEKRGKTLPPLVKTERTCPWYTKEGFEKDFFETEMRQLRDFLYDTRAEQAIFMAERLEKALPKMLSTLPAKKHHHVKTLFNRLSQDSKGLFILLDYVNFKGDGTSPTERYADAGWGLLQVLEAMPLDTAQPHEDFVLAAKKLLSQRVKNAPAFRQEDRWLKGWHKRLNSYLE